MTPIPGSRPRGGFTMIELLIVVAIIGLLAGMMAGAIGYAQSVARRNQCMNNLRQWGGAMSLYLDEHRSRMFPTYKTTDGAKDGDLWWKALPPYLEKGVQPPFWCPDDNDADADLDDSVAARDPSKPETFSYALNPWVHAKNSPPRTHRLRDSQLEFPSAFVVMYEGKQSTEASSGSGVETGLAGTADFLRHHKTTNLLFADGHAESYRQGETGQAIQWDPNKDLKGNPL